MSGRPRPTTALLVAALLLLLLAAPVLPDTDAASVRLTEPARLLGEGGTLSPEAAVRPVPRGEVRGAAMTLTVPRLGIRDLPVPTGSTQRELDREGILHLAGTGLPWREGSNTFIAGHALGFRQTKVPYVFYRLERLRPGDEIIVRDRRGRPYVFRVYDRLTVRPQDYWVTYPVAGQTTISLQTCTPVPTFERRLVVRGELVEDPSG
ncbi:MAG: sortase [Rubrobacter sp.]|nr:sortase [Rubrobacter sp.]